MPDKKIRDEIERVIVKFFKPKELLKIGNRSYRNAFRFPLNRFDLNDFRMPLAARRFTMMSSLSSDIPQVMEDIGQTFIPPSSLIFQLAGKIYDKRSGGKVIMGTDATTLIQAANDALEPNGGKIFVKRGDYALAKYLELSSKVWLDGEGYASHLQLQAGAQTYAEYGGRIMITNKNWHASEQFTKVTNIRVDGGGLNDVKACGIYLAYNEYCEVAGVYAHGFPATPSPSAAILIESGAEQGVKVHHNVCWSTNQSRSGIYIVNPRAHIYCNIIDYVYDGLFLSVYGYAQIFGNLIERCVTGVRVYTHYNVIGANNRFYNCTTGLNFYSGADNNKAKLNTFVGCTTNYVDNGTGNDIADNIEA